MSGRLGALKIIFLVALALAVNHAEQGALSETEPVRMRSKKEIHFREVASVAHTEKVRGPLRVRIEPVGQNGDTFQLLGVFQSSRNLQDVAYQWALPKGSVILDGAIDGMIPHLAANQPVSIEITFRSTSLENQQIHLSAKAREGRRRFGDVAQYNTVDQEAIEQEQNRLRKSTLDAFKNEPKHKFKVQH